MKKQFYLIAVTASILATSAVRSAGEEFRVEIEVDLQQDVGQNFGTLFEAVDAKGNVVAGAGYVGSYNTQARSDRRNLHFFVKPDSAIAFEPRRLPRPTSDAGTYLFEFDNRLFSKVRGGLDGTLRVWQKNSNAWIEDQQTAPFSVSVGNGVLTSDAKGIYFDGQPVLTLQPEQGSVAERYYANGQVVFRRYDAEADPAVNELVACAWTHEHSEPVVLDDGRTIAMRTPREFVYAYGQLENQIVAATNTGGIYVFDGKAWEVILEPDINVSYQIYAIINYGDRLLMGQYPTGELFFYDGQELKHLPKWPPVMKGVSTSAREAQTLTIYCGDLYCGVWPWGEVWKYDGDSSGWNFQGRMFTHPQPTDETTHPYENETKQLGSVLNRWGQRVTSLVPLGDSLFISTSSKGGAAWEPKFDFLAGEKWKEYGAVYEYRQPGALVVRTNWTEGPTTFEFAIKDNKMRVLQDGQPLAGLAATPSSAVAPLSQAKYKWGEGIFGPLRGKLLSHERD